MRKIKLFFFIIIIILLTLNFFINSIILGKLWKNLHVNSLIGLQKSLEGSFIQSKINIDIWYYIFIPVLNQTILFIIAIILFIIFLLLNIRN